MAGRKKKDIFSVTKAVRANARSVVGQPPPERVLRDESKQQERARKHKQTLGSLLGQAGRE